jgi:pimeloyl-ACP methyl ester carboxylesterase
LSAPKRSVSPSRAGQATPGRPRLQRTASQIPGAEFVEMKAIGHFPMSENYPVFKGYLVQALDLIRTKTSARA